MRKIFLALSISLVLTLAFGGVMVFAANAAELGNPLYSLDRGLDAAVSFLQEAVNAADSNPESLVAQDDSPFTLGDEGNGTTDDDPLDDPDDPEDPKDSAYCPCDVNNPHPVGAKLAEKYTVEYDVIMGKFCDGGFGFGEIDRAYRIAAANPGVTVDEIFGMRTEGKMGWGQIMKEYPLPKPPKDPKPGVGLGNGNAGGNGNAYGHDKNNNNGNAGGNGNGNAYGKTKNADKGNKGGKGKP
jgi:hypothetical protein